MYIDIKNKVIYNNLDSNVVNFFSITGNEIAEINRNIQNISEITQDEKNNGFKALLDAFNENQLLAYESNLKNNVKQKWIELKNSHSKVKTFTSNITAQNITNLQNQMNGLSGLVSGGKYPYLLHDGQVTARIGDYDGEFRNLTDALKYLKQNGSKDLNSNITLNLGYTDFNDDITLSNLPPMTINCSYRKLGNNLHIKNCPNIYIIGLKLSGTLTVENSNVFLGDYFDTRKIIAKKNSLITLGSHSNRYPTNIFSVEAYESKIIFEGSFIDFKSDNSPCIVADNNSTIILGSFLDFYPANNHAAIVSKFGSQIILKGKFYKQYRGAYFAWVDSGGKIIGNNDLSLEVRSITKTNIAPNTWSPNGMILGSDWR